MRVIELQDGRWGGFYLTTPVLSEICLCKRLALTLSFVWLGEVPSLFSLAGGVVALSGVAILNLWGR